MNDIEKQAEIDRLIEEEYEQRAYEELSEDYPGDLYEMGLEETIYERAYEMLEDDHPELMPISEDDDRKRLKDGSLLNGWTIFDQAVLKLGIKTD